LTIVEIKDGIIDHVGTVVGEQTDWLKAGKLVELVFDLVDEWSLGRRMEGDFLVGDGRESENEEEKGSRQWRKETGEKINGITGKKK